MNTINVAVGHLRGGLVTAAEATTNVLNTAWSNTVAGVSQGLAVIATVLGATTFVTASAIGFVVTKEVTGTSKWASLRILRSAVDRLPERRREVRREEWKAEWESFGEAHVARLLWAVHTWFGAWRIARRERPAAATAPGTIGSIRIVWTVTDRWIVGAAGKTEVRAMLGEDSSVEEIKKDLEWVLRNPPTGLQGPDGLERITVELRRRRTRGKHRR